MKDIWLVVMSMGSYEDYLERPVAWYMSEEAALLHGQRGDAVVMIARAKHRVLYDLLIRSDFEDEAVNTLITNDPDLKAGSELYGEGEDPGDVAFKAVQVSRGDGGPMPAGVSKPPWDEDEYLAGLAKAKAQREADLRSGWLVTTSAVVIGAELICPVGRVEQEDERDAKDAERSMLEDWVGHHAD